MTFITLLVAFVIGIILVLVIRKLFPAQMMVRALLIAFIVGGLMIVVIRILFPSLAGGLVAATLAAVTIVILGIFYGKQRSEMDNHRAGDNLYYLGLLFTLISLAYVLVSLFIIGSNDDLEQRVNMLVGNFGIALSSTVVGILGRIVMQSIGDAPQTLSPLEVEVPVNPREPGRVEIVESVESAVGDAMMLRRQIREATEAFSHFTRVTLNQAELFRRDAETLRELEAIGEDDAIGQARELQRAKEATKEAQRETERLSEELHVLRTKGQNPPCWYHEVPDGSGGKREKPYYTFDVGVFEDHMIIRRLETPPGRAVNDGISTYLEEAKLIGLGDIPYDEPLDDAAILRYLQPIHNAGKGKRVRSYSCIFWVRVWDNTSASAKKRWQKAHDVILEGLFGAYTVQDTPWQ